MPHRRSKKDPLKSGTRSLPFETSVAFRQLFTYHYAEWVKRNRSDLAELADKLGVSYAYLGQVKRYGRVPSKPVLILMSLLFKASGEEFFRAANIRDPFPFDPSLQITEPAGHEESILSLKFNSDVFTQAIRSVVRSELRTRSVKDVLGDRPLRIGLNYHYYWLFDTRVPHKAEEPAGLFPEFCALLGTALQKEIELTPLSFSDALDALQAGKIDLYGPMMAVPNQPSHIHFSVPLFRIGISALYRKKELADLPRLPAPDTVEELRSKNYRIAVLRNSHPHLIANTLLKKTDSELILVSSDDEGVERVTMRGISRPAHLFITNSATAHFGAKQHPKDLSIHFIGKHSFIDLEDCGLAVRPDWPEVIPLLNDGIRFLLTRGGLTDRLKELKKGELHDAIEVVS